MTCEKCGLVLPEDAIRTHEGRWLCPLHKALAVSMPEPHVAAGLDVGAAIESVALRFEAFRESQAESLLAQERRISDALARHRTESMTRAAQVDTHESRLAVTEASLGAARDILGDVSTRGDVSAQIGTLAAEIAALKTTQAAMSDWIQAAHDNHLSLAARVGVTDVALTAHTHKTFWQRLRWLLLGR